MKNDQMITIGILAGGESKRMGQNKALLDFHGMPLIQHIVERVKSAADEMIILANDPQPYQFLRLPVFPDVFPGSGVLGGIHTAMKTAKNEFLSTLGCDVPYVSILLLWEELRLIKLSCVDVVIPESENGLEPLHAVYRRATCLPAVEAAIKKCDLRIISWFDQVNVKILSLPNVKRIDPDPHIFVNLNSPEDLLKTGPANSR